MNAVIFRSVRRDLHTRYGHRADAPTIDAILDEVIAGHTATARIPDFLPVLVHREAAGRIEDHLWAHGDVGTPRRRILFASRTNAARAVLAAALARRLSDNAIVATVAGTSPEHREDALIEWVMDEQGLTTDGPRFKTERRRTLAAADVVVYLDAEEPHDLAGRSFVQWDVPATTGMDIEGVRAFADDMETRVADLLAGLDIPLRSLPAAEKFAA